jgi:FtsP/CotA-like multicopper oxidase with cupredoxin domain
VAVPKTLLLSSATNFFIDTGELDATITATDGENVNPLKGNFFQLAVAQRLDLLVTIPANGGVFPILALGEGSTLQTGFLLATPGTEPAKLGLQTRSQRMAGGLDNTQEIRLEAQEPLPDRSVQRLPSVRAGWKHEVLQLDYQWCELSQPQQSQRQRGGSGLS